MYSLHTDVVGSFHILPVQSKDKGHQPGRAGITTLGIILSEELWALRTHNFCRLALVWTFSYDL